MTKIQLKKLSIGKLGVIDLDLPYLVFGKGKPCGLVLGLQHGGELSSLAVITKLLEDQKIAGQAIIVPVVNPLGLLFKSRNEPLDGSNLNRTFPGKENGDLGQRICAKIFALAKSCDFVIDLHTFSERLTCVIGGFAKSDNRDLTDKTLKMLKNFNPDIVWQTDLKRKEDVRFFGAIDNVSLAEKIPTIFIEMPNISFITDEQIEKVTNGIISVFQNFGNRKTSARKIPSFYSQSLFADQSGLFTPRLFPKDKIKIGEILGEVRILPEFKKVEVRSPYSGVIMGILGKNFVRVGTKIVSIGEFAGNI